MGLIFGERRGRWVDKDPPYEHAGVHLTARDTVTTRHFICVATTPFMEGHFNVRVKEGEDTVNAVEHYRDVIEQCFDAKHGQPEAEPSPILYLLPSDIGIGPR